MSRYIPDNRPYTEEEREYLLTRPNGEQLLAVNDRRFAHLSDEEKEELTARVSSDTAKEEYIKSLFEKEEKEEEGDLYHPDDVAQVQGLKIAELRDRLEREGQRTNVLAEDKDPDDDNDSPLTEKQVLAYRLLNWLDEKRKASTPPANFDEDAEKNQNKADDQEADDTKE